MKCPNSKKYEDQSRPGGHCIRLHSCFTAAEAYLDAVSDTSMNEKQQTYRNMCLKNELMDFNATTRTIFASLKPAERNSQMPQKSVNEKRER